MVSILFFFVILLMVLLGFILFWRKLINLRDYVFLRRKSSTFECGYEVKDQSRQPFSLRFFLIIIVFLVFDIELCLLLNIPLLKLKFFLNRRFIIYFILFILLGGILEEWRRGLLIWK